MDGASVYEIRIRGHLDQSWSEWFEGLEIIAEPDGVTVLRGELVDQAALYSTLDKIENLGLALLSVLPQAT